MKTNKMMRIASVLLVAVLLSTCAISGTFAKYVTTASGNDTARVALWDVSVVDFYPTNATFTFNVFDTVMDTDDVGDDDDNDADIDDATPGNNAIVAPGSWGYYDFKVTNSSEVNATFSVTMTEAFTTAVQNAVSPIQYKVEVVSEGEAAELPTDGFAKANNGSIAIGDATVGGDIAMNGGTEVIRVYWQWTYDGEAYDTELGIDGASTINVAANLTITQVN